MVSVTVDYLIAQFPKLSDWCLTVFKNDMKEQETFAERDGSNRIWGDECDYSDWMRFCRKLDEEIEKRKQGREA